MRPRRRRGGSAPLPCFPLPLLSKRTSSDRSDGHIVAMGGGGFSMEPDNPLMDDFVLGLSRQQPARVCFIPTASADSATYIVRFYRALSGAVSLQT